MKYGLLVISLIALVGVVTAITYASKQLPRQSADAPVNTENKEILNEVPVESADEDKKAENATETVKTDKGEYTITRTENGVTVEYYSNSDGSVRSRQEVRVSGNGSVSSRVQSSIRVSE